MSQGRIAVVEVCVEDKRLVGDWKEDSELLIDGEGYGAFAEVAAKPMPLFLARMLCPTPNPNAAAARRFRTFVVPLSYTSLLEDCPI